MSQSRSYPDGTLEFQPPLTTPTFPPSCGPPRVRIGAGPWLPVRSDASVYAALDRIRDCKTARDAMAILRPSDSPEAAHPIAE